MEVLHFDIANGEKRLKLIQLYSSVDTLGGLALRHSASGVTDGTSLQWKWVHGWGIEIAHH